MKIKNLVIVESPAKAKTIEKFLGNDFLVKSCYGHIRDLVKEKNGVIVEQNFLPLYEISEDKRKVVSELKKLASESDTVWLATDEDREGEAIAWHLREALKLKSEKTKRIVFHEITKEAILKSIQNPRSIDENLVDAQQSRRILDRLVGFELSPLLWKKIKPSLSAGRVQSVAVRLIVEREREIESFESDSFHKVTANFEVRKENKKQGMLKSELNEKFESEEAALKFLENCKSALFSIISLDKREIKRSPAAPFTTSTLQQEANRKLRFSVSRTMTIAQKLYEAGYITYMRTDSVNLAESAISAIQTEVNRAFGKEYSNPKRFKTKSANAQEAHEAIRPTYFDRTPENISTDEKKLYELIYKRTIASQMSDARIEKNTATVGISNDKRFFTAEAEVILFDGFLKVYRESNDDEESESAENKGLPPLTVGEEVFLGSMFSTQRFSKAAPRYNEASLVKKLEELGIGRPSTYASIISTVQNRGYVIKEDREGVERNYVVLELDSSKQISKKIEKEITGTEKAKLFPSDVAMLVNDFLFAEFPQIMDYKFTAKIEQELDEVAGGKIEGNSLLESFYFPFHERIEQTTESSKRVTGERILGLDPKTNLTLSVRMGRYGAYAQKYDPENEEIKPKYASLRKGQRLETIEFEEALELFKLPRTVGEKDGEEISINIGRFGPYVKFNSKFYSIPKDRDPFEVQMEEALEIIAAKDLSDINKNIKLFAEEPELKILNGRYGPYISYKSANYKIPKGIDPAELSLEGAKEIINSQGEKKPAKGKRGKK